MQTKKIEKNNEAKSWIFGKINKIDNPLTRLTKTQITNIRNETDDISMHPVDIKMIIRKY